MLSSQDRDVTTHLLGMSPVQSVEIKTVPVWGHAVTWLLVTGFVTPSAFGGGLRGGSPETRCIMEHPCSEPAGSSGVEGWDVQEKPPWDGWSSQPLLHHIIVLCGEKRAAGRCAMATPRIPRMEGVGRAQL